jgi:crotonobetainyl-CoA:carnitine CoA-transferase CaiB-like acyl-CoA transferase
LTELAADPRFATNQQRVGHRAQLIDRLCRATRTRSTAEWVADLARVGVPCGPINTVDAVFADPQVRARAMQVELPHRGAGTVPLVANPLRLSATPVSNRSAPPTLGSHTREVLRERLDLSAAHIEALTAKGVI